MALLRAVLAAALVACASALEAQVDRGNVLVYKTVAFTQIAEKSDAGLLEREVLVVGVPFKVTYLVFNLGAWRGAARGRRQGGCPRHVDVCATRE